MAETKNGDDEERRAKEALQYTAVDPTDYDDVSCGIGSFRPACLQPCATITPFVAFISIAGFLSSCLSAYISSQITTLERMFGFSSQTSGLIMACNDIGYLLSILIATYFARRTHIPRVLYLVVTFYGVSGLICCIPYFLTSDKFRLNNMASLPSKSKSLSSASLASFTKLCSRNETAFDRITMNACGEDTEGGQSASLFGLSEYESTLAIVLIAGGMILQGFAKAPRHPFINTYIDDNAKKTKSPMYIGIVFGVAIFGPAIAFSLGGLFSRIYVTLEGSDMNYRDPKWVGAWWLGFLIFGAAAVLFATPLCLFPRHLLPKSERLSVNKPGQKQSVNLKDFKGLLQALGRLATNPVYCPFMIASVAHSLSFAGTISFYAKYIETQFYVPVWKANIIVGGCSIMSASTGAFFSGKIISKFKLTPTACMKMLVGLSSFHFLSQIVFFFLGCPQQDVRADWSAVGVKYGSSLNNVSCLAGCYCDTLPFRPVCDMENGVTYYSACHAGCSTRNGTTYTDCSCIPSGEVLSGYCPSTCSLLTPFIVILSISSFSGALTIMNFMVVLMRSVSEEDKPLALGVNSFLSNLFGWMPGPILFGRLIDTTCLIWNTKCSRVGSCSMYDAQDFRYKLNGLTVGLRVISLTLNYFVLYKIVTTNFFDASNMAKRNDKHRKESEHRTQLKDAVDRRDDRAVDKDEIHENHELQEYSVQQPAEAEMKLLQNGTSSDK